jgi:hypothetical protein
MRFRACEQRLVPRKRRQAAAFTDKSPHNPRSLERLRCFGGTSALRRTPPIRSNGTVKVTGFTTHWATRLLASDALRGKCAPLRQCNRASLLVNLPGDEMPLLIEMILDLGVN